MKMLNYFTPLYLYDGWVTLQIEILIWQHEISPWNTASFLHSFLLSFQISSFNSIFILFPSSSLHLQQTKTLFFLTTHENVTFDTSVNLKSYFSFSAILWNYACNWVVLWVLLKLSIYFGASCVLVNLVHTQDMTPKQSGSSELLYVLNSTRCTR